MVSAGDSDSPPAGDRGPPADEVCPPADEVRPPADIGADVSVVPVSTFLSEARREQYGVMFCAYMHELESAV